MTPLVVPSLERPLALCEVRLSAASARLESMWGPRGKAAFGLVRRHRRSTAARLWWQPEKVKNDGFANAERACFIAARNRPFLTFWQSAGRRWSTLGQKRFHTAMVVPKALWPPRSCKNRHFFQRELPCLQPRRTICKNCRSLQVGGSDQGTWRVG